MATKRELIADPNSAWNKAADNEPLFVLRGQDKLAPPLVDMWAQLAWVVGDETDELDAKTEDAADTAAAMRDWPRAEASGLTMHMNDFDQGAARLEQIRRAQQSATPSVIACTQCGATGGGHRPECSRA